MLTGVRTRHGWFTWGRLAEINGPQSKGLHFKQLPQTKRSHESCPLVYADCMAQRLSDAAVACKAPHEDAVWIDMARVLAGAEQATQSALPEKQQATDDKPEPEPAAINAAAAAPQGDTCSPQPFWLRCFAEPDEPAAMNGAEAQ
eukprot:COSAG03_NODE_9239_length_736_cov_1.226060_2_plen_144_part_01